MSDRRVAWTLFGLFLCAFLLTSGGHFYSADGGKEYEVTRSIVTRHALDVPQPLGLKGRGGKFYPPHGVGQSVAWIPFYAGGAVLQHVGFGAASHGLAASSLNALATAATAALLFLLARAIGSSRGASVAVALAYGFTTMAWVYSKNTFDVVLTGMLLTGGAYLLFCGRKNGHLKTFVFAGACFGWAGVTRVPTLVVWPIAGLAVLLSDRDRMNRIFAFGSPLAASLFVVFLYNWLRFGSIVNDGHKADTATAFTGNPFEGFFGMLVSPARGIVFFAPLILVAIGGWTELRRRSAWLAWFAPAAFGATLIVYSKVQGWEGGFSWGPRFLLPVLPLAVLPAALVFDRWRAVSTIARTSIVVALTGGFLLTLPGVLADYQIETLLQEQHGVSITKVWDFSNAGYVYHARTLDDIARGDAPFPAAKAESGRPAENTWDFWWWYAWLRHTSRALVVLVVAALLAGAVFLGRKVTASARPDARRSPT